MKHDSPLALTFDFGTQSVKVALFDDRGDVVAFEKEDYEEPYVSPLPNFAEQRPDYYYECMCRAAKRLTFTVEGTAEERQAQVRRGGIPFNAVDAGRLSLMDPRLGGVYACGEALDMDADCGGFNLAWAWTSGLVTGSAAAREATR